MIVTEGGRKLFWFNAAAILRFKEIPEWLEREEAINLYANYYTGIRFIDQCPTDGDILDFLQDAQFQSIDMIKIMKDLQFVLHLRKYNDSKFTDMIEKIEEVRDFIIETEKKIFPYKESNLIKNWTSFVNTEDYLKQRDREHGNVLDKTSFRKSKKGNKSRDKILIPLSIDLLRKKYPSWFKCNCKERNEYNQLVWKQDRILRIKEKVEEILEMCEAEKTTGLEKTIKDYLKEKGLV